jgi:probable biosynthetic protein (TIGR04098 family)
LRCYTFVGIGFRIFHLSAMTACTVRSAAGETTHIITKRRSERMSEVQPVSSEISLGDYCVELGMPHLGRSGLNESSLLKAIGHDRWQTLERLTSVRTSDIRDAFDNRLYATFCFVEIMLSAERPLSAYDENDRLAFSRDLSHYSRIYLDGSYQLRERGPFAMRCTNVFIYQLGGPQQLKMSQPENCDFDRITELPAQPDSLTMCRAAKEAGTFQPLEPGGLDLGSVDVHYPLDADRDANGAGLIYFANFVCFLDFAERALLKRHNAPEDLIDARSTYWRRIGYFGNAQVTDTLKISILGRAHLDETRLRMGFDYRIYRASDEKLILVSSSRKSANLTPQGRTWFEAAVASQKTN